MKKNIIINSTVLFQTITPLRFGGDGYINFLEKVRQEIRKIEREGHSVKNIIIENREICQLYGIPLKFKQKLL